MSIEEMQKILDMNIVWNKGEWNFMYKEKHE